MSDVTSIDDRTLSFSLRRLGDELGIDREKLGKLIAAAGVKAAGRRGGHPVYRLRDVVPVLIARADDGDGTTVDPMKMTPPDRRAHYQAARERLRYEEECGQLIPAAEVHGEMAFIAKTVARALSTLPDTFERDTRCGPKLVEHLEKLVRKVRVELATKLSQYEDDDVRDRA